MPIEIEAKYKVDELEVYKDTLEGCGAEYVSEVEQVDLYFDSESRELLQRDSGLRVRREITAGVERAEICYKGRRADGQFKRRTEIEVQVDNSRQAVLLLENLGYRNLLTVNKIRRMWLLDNCQICLDQVEQLGCFVEIEGPDEDTIKTVSEKLQLQEHKHISSSYAHLLAEKT